MFFIWELRIVSKLVCNLCSSLCVLYRYKHLQLTATRSTRYEPLKTDEESPFYHPRIFTPVSQLGGRGRDQLTYREVDTVGMVVCICSDHVMSHDPDDGEGRQVDSVYVADAEGCLMVVRMWEGLKVSWGEEPIYMYIVLWWLMHVTMWWDDYTNEFVIIMMILYNSIWL